jgi:FdhE protein
MPSTVTAAPSLAEVARGRAEWRPWLALLEATHEATRDTAWAAAVPASPAETDRHAPLLAGATLTVDPRLLRRWLGRAIRTAAAGTAVPLAAAARADTDRLAALLEAGLVEDAGRVAAISAALGVDAGALGAVAGVAPVPLLRACAARWANRVPPAWSHGACPMCGAWAAFAELRGLEQARHLRCLRCAADWATSWLRCPFCGADDHETLGSLVLTLPPEDDGPLRLARVATGVDTCAACRGYLKTVTTLAPTPADDLGLLDLTTVDLDAAALARGYARPAGPGVRLGARVLVREQRRRWWGA